jgi:hypothetical protein
MIHQNVFSRPESQQAIRRFTPSRPVHMKRMEAVSSTTSAPLAEAENVGTTNIRPG